MKSLHEKTSSPLIILQVIVLTLSISIQSLAAGSGVPIQYQSPLPDAHYILPQTSIIIRPAELVDPTSINTPGLFIVEGSLSGSHSGNVILSDDGQTVLFKPDEAFAGRETVTVNLRPGLRTITGEPVSPTTFSFFTVGKRDPDGDTFLPFSLYGTMRSDHSPHELPFPDAWPARVDTLPADFPRITTTVNGPQSPGNLFLANLKFANPYQTYLMILENDGTPIFYKSLRGAGLDFKTQPNGRLTFFDTFAQKFYALDASYQVVDSFKCGDGYVTDLHDILLLTNGHVMLMSYDPQVVNMSEIVPGGRPEATVIGFVIQELDLARNVVFQWRSWDHMEITDAPHEDLTAATIDWVHGNAFEIDYDGNILISSRHLDEITKISRTTGEITWRMGGTKNEFTFVNDSIGFNYQHAIRRLENGNYTLYDNGNFHSPPFSRAVEYHIDQQAKTVTLVWEYRHIPDRYGFAMGYVQRLPNGNTLIGWGSTNPSVTEVRPDGSIAFELSFEPGTYSYRAYRQVWGKPVRVDEVENLPLSINLHQNYPNPFNGTTIARVSLTRATNITLKVFDVLGQEVMTPINNEEVGPGEYNIPIDASGLSSGVYYYRLEAGDFSDVKKMMMLR